MSFERSFNSTNIFGGTAFAASIVGSLLGEIASAVQHGRTMREKPQARTSPSCGSAFCLRMVERHGDFLARNALRILDESKRDFDQTARNHPLGKNANSAYMHIYRYQYLRAYAEIQYLREWNNELYSNIAHTLGHRPLGAGDLGYLRLQWVVPIKRKIAALVNAMDHQHRAVDGELKELGRGQGAAVFAWLASTQAMHEGTVAKLRNLHDTLDAALVSEIVDRRTARELGE